jgi:hypothetical protein
MVIRKRRSVEDVAEEKLGPDWKRVLLHPVMQTLLSSSLFHQESSASHIIALLNQAKASHRFNDIPLQEKLFLYCFCSVAWRGLGLVLLTDPEYNMLVRHLYSGKCLDKIEGHAVPLAHRQAFLWDMPELAKKYKKQGTLSLPKIVNVEPSVKRKRLPKHRA